MNNALILTFGNFDYQSIILNWTNCINDLGIENYLVISLDKKIHENLNLKKINTELIEYNKKFENFWEFRTKIIINKLEQGYDVIHSDADAYWIQNPIHKYFAQTDCDILTSQGTIFPHQVLSKLGFVACCGLVYYKNTKKTIDFLHKMQKITTLVKDDQKAFNYILAELPIKWDNSEPTYTLSYNGLKFNCYDSIHYGIASNLKIGLLPHHHFQRVEMRNTAFVLHKISDKNATSKIDSFNKISSKQINKISSAHKMNSNTIIKKDMKKQNRTITWLASYPRSGNTMLRIIFNNNFNQNTYSVYNDPADIGKIPAISTVTGHKNLDPTKVKEYRKNRCIEALLDKTEDRNIFIKTHYYNEKNNHNKSIYIFRDGRAALSSYVAYKKKFTNEALEEKELLERLIICGDLLAGYWDEHITSWTINSEYTLILKYEDLIASTEKALNNISKFINLPLLNNKIISFDHLHKLSSDFFRKGTKKTWNELFDRDDENLFLLFYGKTMIEKGYIKNANIFDLIIKETRANNNTPKEDIISYLIYRYSKSIKKHKNYILRPREFNKKIENIVYELNEYIDLCNLTKKEILFNILNSLKT